MDIVRKKRIVTKIGDVFCIVIDNDFKCYFQYIANDMKMLNSSVIRVFKTHYPLDANPLIEDVVTDEVDFYAHTVLRTGIADCIWEKVGKITDLDSINFSEIIFYVTEFLEALKFNPNTTDIFKNPLENWRVWTINGSSVHYKTLPEELQNKALMEGRVLPYSSIIDKIKYGYYKDTSPDYDIIKRIPKRGVDSYLRKETVSCIRYYQFRGETLVDYFILAKGEVLKLKGLQSIDNIRFWDINWKYWNFITEQEFNTVKKQYLEPSDKIQCHGN